MAVPAPQSADVPDEEVQQQVRRICDSATFRGAGRLRRFLEFIVGEVLAGRKDKIKEYSVGVAVFDKPASFDPRTDPIVRVRARRLRAMLERYYRDEAAGGELVIELPKGGYLPVFHHPQPGTAKPSLTLALATRNTVAVAAWQEFSAELGTFCQELRQEIVCALTQVRELRVLADAGGAKAEAAVVVSGSARASGDRIRLLIHIVEAASGCYLWSGSLEGGTAERWALQQEAARLVASKLEGQLTSAGGARRQHRIENLAARNLYLQGRYHLGQRTEEGLRKAAELFERALAEDSQFALAHAGLADAYSLLGHYGVLAPPEVWTRTAAFAAHAVMLDANLAEAHASLAHVKASQDWDWAGAEQQFQQALRLDPSYATARHWYAMSCLAPLGRLQEALEELRIAQSLDPVAAIIARDIAVAHFYRREFDSALEQCDHTIELNPHFAPAFWTLGRVQEARGDFEEAAAALQNAIRLVPTSPRFHAALGHLYGSMKKRQAAQAVLKKLGQLAPERYVSPIEFALVYFAVGQADAGFEWLAKACQDRCYELVYLNVDPAYDDLRQDERFAAAVAKLGLGEAAK